MSNPRASAATCTTAQHLSPCLSAKADAAEWAPGKDITCPAGPAHGTTNDTQHQQRARELHMRVRVKAHRDSGDVQFVEKERVEIGLLLLRREGTVNVAVVVGCGGGATHGDEGVGRQFALLQH